MARSTRWANARQDRVAFCVALVSYNLMSVIKAALRSVHGAADRRREGVGVLPGQRGYDDSQGNDDRDNARTNGPCSRN